MQFGTDFDKKNVKSSRAAQKSSRKLYQVKRGKSRNFKSNRTLKSGTHKSGTVNSPVQKFRISKGKFGSKSKTGSGKIGLSQTLYGNQSLNQSKKPQLNTKSIRKEIKKFETKFISSVFQQFLSKNDHRKNS
jgi:hypothetical protein